MPNVGQGRERFEVNVPAGFRVRLDALMASFRREAEDGEAPRWSDRGAFLDWFLGRAEAVLAAEAEAQRLLEQARAKAEEAERREADANARMAQVEQAEAQLLAADAELRRQVGLSRAALRLVTECLDAGCTRDDVLATLAVIRHSGLDPHEVARNLQRENIRGLLDWGAQLRQACEVAEASATSLREQVSALRQAIQKLQEQRARLEKELEGARADLEAALRKTVMVEATARDLGLYVEALKNQGVERIEQLPPATGRLLAGTILFAVAEAYGDDPVTVAPGFGHPVPVQVTMKELAFSLAPRESYRAQQKAALKREALAEAFAVETDSGRNEISG
jgi:DNA-binding transcriptional MerR regulator